MTRYNRLMNDTKTTKKPSLSSLIVEFLAAKGRKSRKAGIATTEELAAAVGYPLKQVYDRAYWLAKRESKLQMTGSGKAALWRSTPKVRKAKAESEVSMEATEAVTLTPAEVIEA